jgi:hypothetical protein
MRGNRGSTLLFLLVTSATGVLAILLGVFLWSHAPMSWQTYLESADGTLALIGLFVGLPLVLALLWALGFVCGALALTPFVSRESAERALLSYPYGGHIGKFEAWLLARFKPHAR